MKTLFLLLILVSTSKVNAEPGCFGGIFFINQKIDKSHFGGVYYHGGGYFPRVILVSKIHPLHQGKNYLPVKKIDSKAVELNNGFTETADVYKICDDQLVMPKSGPDPTPQPYHRPMIDENDIYDPAKDDARGY